MSLRLDARDCLIKSKRAALWKLGFGGGSERRAEPGEVASGVISIVPLADIGATISDVTANDGVEKGFRQSGAPKKSGRL